MIYFLWGGGTKDDENQNWGKENRYFIWFSYIFFGGGGSFLSHREKKERHGKHGSRTQGLFLSFFQEKDDDNIQPTNSCCWPLWYFFFALYRRLRRWWRWFEKVLLSHLSTILTSFLFWKKSINGKILINFFRWWW